jgi:hypothetical protein
VRASSRWRSATRAGRDRLAVAPGSGTVDGVAYLLRDTADGPSTEGVTRLSGDTFDDTEGGLGLLRGGGAVAHQSLSGPSLFLGA